MNIRLATWNVNSVRKRIDGLAHLLEEEPLDVLCLQETKVVDEDFPHNTLSEMGFPYQAFHGQKSYNGVAVLSRLPLREIKSHNWCGLEDRRHLAATLSLPSGEDIEIHSLYIPAGGDIPDAQRNPKFAHKLKFLKELSEWSKVARQEGRRLVLAGDFNVAPLETDVWSHEKLKNVVTHTDIERELFTAAQESGGWTDALRQFIPQEQRVYTWWSYRSPDWNAADKGRRLDHVWLSPSLSDCLQTARALRSVRGWETPSDHVPVVVEIRPPAGSRRVR